MVYPVERVQLLQKTEFSICLPNDVISQHCKSWHFKSRKQLLKVVKPGVNYLTDYSVICQTWNWFWHNTEHACHLFQILQWFFQWLFAYFNNCLLHLPTWNWFWHTCHLFQQLHHQSPFQLTSITRVSDMIGVEGLYIFSTLLCYISWSLGIEISTQKSKYQYQREHLVGQSTRPSHI